MAGVSGLSGPGLGSLALSVHGPAGVLDVVVPPEASADDVAREYAAQCRLPGVPPLLTRLGTALPSDVPLRAGGVETGDLLIVAGPVAPPSAPRSLLRLTGLATDTSEPGGLSALWFSVCGGLAALAGWCGIHATGGTYAALLALLVAAAFVGVLPVGRFTPHRAVAAPAFAAAAGFVVAWDPEPERLPTVLGITALVAAVTAAVARALDPAAEETLRVWILAGVGVFVTTTACALIGFGPQVVWAVLLLAAMLAARLVPSVAVDVPDQFLIDIERLAVTAWSARSRPTGRRARTLVTPAAMSAVAARGTRLLTAASAAVLLTMVVCAPLLLHSATASLDRVGARAMVLLAGASLLFAARSYRHVAARALLRVAGLVGLASGAVVVVVGRGPGAGIAIGVVSVAVAAVLVVVAVATGRGWRSASWSRRAEVFEGLTGAFAVGSVILAVGLFRALWEKDFHV